MIKLVSYHNYKNCDFAQLVTIYNFMLYKCEKLIELQKSENDTLYVSSQISPLNHGCSNHSNLEMEAEFLMKNLSYLNLNISRTKNCRNKL